MEAFSIAYVGGGCFWGLEAVFKNLKGVACVQSGFSGGIVPGCPTYKEVSSGKTGHAEVIKITYNTKIISYTSLLLIFLKSHDPTIPQVAKFSFGHQYRSVLFYVNEAQKEMAKTLIKELSSRYDQPIRTAICAFNRFYKAEEYHQNYYSKNKNESYCTTIIAPKLEKIQTQFEDKFTILSLALKS